MPPETRKAILGHYTEKVTKISVNDATVTELTTAFLLIVALAIAPLFRPISPRSLLFRSNLNPPAFAMISSNRLSGRGLRDQDLSRRGPGLGPSKAPPQVALLAKRGDDAAAASPFPISSAESGAQELIVAPSGLEIPSSSSLVRPV